MPGLATAPNLPKPSSWIQRRVRSMVTYDTDGQRMESRTTHLTGIQARSTGATASAPCSSLCVPRVAHRCKQERCPSHNLTTPTHPAFMSSSPATPRLGGERWSERGTACGGRAGAATKRRHAHASRTNWRLHSRAQTAQRLKVQWTPSTVHAGRNGRGDAARISSCS